MRTLLICWLLVVANAAAAQDDFSDLFGDALKSDSNLDDVKKAAGDIKTKESSSRLEVKTSEGDEFAKMEFLGVFAAQRIVINKKEGCIPGDAGRTKLSYLAFDELPETSDGFAVCLSLKSRIGRELRVTTRIVDQRNRRIGKGTDVIDFRGRELIHHVLEFPPLEFPHVGKYFYVVEIDGKEKARMPLFDVKLLEN